MDSNRSHPRSSAKARALPVREWLIGKDDRVLVAVSGGADSTALLLALHKLSSRLGNEIAVGHFDHRLRETSSVDKRRVEVMAANLGVPFHEGEGDVHRRAEVHGETIEEAARKLRYRFLYQLAEKIDATLIATGHTLDDQIETVLMRILRGTGVRGLAGIPEKRGKLIRPILGATREQTVAYCRDNHIAWVEDPSNSDMRFTRNWIRSELLPMLRTFFPNVGENLLQLSKNSAGTLKRVRKVTTPLINRFLKQEPEGNWTLDLAEVTNLDNETKYVLFGDLLTEHLGCDPDFSHVHFEKLARLSGASTASGQVLSIPGITVRREYDALVFFSSRTAPSKVDSVVDAAELPIPGRVTFGGLGVRSAVLPAKTYDANEYRAVEPSLFESNGPHARGAAYFDLEAVEPPLSIRFLRPGDKMRPFGMDGHKKISDILSDKKVPLRRRGQTVVISDQKEILWLVGVTTTESTRISSASKKILKLTVVTE